MVNNTNKNNNNNHMRDGILAQLTEMFGEFLPLETIVKIGQEQKWNLEDCIEKLIKFNANKLTSSTNMDFNTIITSIPAHSRQNANAIDEDDADILIESEEIQNMDTTGPVDSTTTNDSCRYTGTIKKTQSAAAVLINTANDTNAINPYGPDANAQFTFSSFLKNITNQFADNTAQSPINKQRRLQSTMEHPQLDETIHLIQQGYKVMIIMRGIPGSGKSYLARKIVDRTANGDCANHLFSTDDFFYDRKTKQYVFQRELIGQAHEFNQKRVKSRTSDGWSPIIVDNTNVKLWEMFPYVECAVKHGYVIKILEPNTPWAKSVGKLVQNNKHNVPRETIERMLRDFETASVEELFRILRINYQCVIPQPRRLPKLQVTQNESAAKEKSEPPAVNNEVMNARNRSEGIQQIADSVYGNTPKPMRNQRKPKLATSLEAPIVVKTFDETDPMAVNQMPRFEDEWQTFEENTKSFWGTSDNTSTPKSDVNQPKPQRKPVQAGVANFECIYDLLKDKVETPAQAPVQNQSNNNPIAEPLEKHEKGCTNENKSFQLIRQIYPNVPVSLLWDLFEKCNGDGDWTMDILLNEGAVDGFEKLESEEAIQRDNFVCNCRSSSVSLELQQAANAIPAQLLQQDKPPPGQPVQQPERNQRKEAIDRNCDSEIRKRIEEQFVISDEHYSSHVKKIRDFRRGIVSNGSTQKPEASAIELNGQLSLTIDENNAENEEMIEIDLGVELVCQLDSSFGTDMFQKDVLKDIKTTVFMPRSLGQQLYAIWVESLYNQIEEQRQKSIKDDEEFAKELYIKEKYPQLLQDKPPDTIKDIMEMEIAWKAYKADIDEWKKTTPQDLASKLTRTKLFELFPNINKSTLVEVLAAHGHKFSKTVEVLNTTLQSDVGPKMQVEGQRLLNQAQNETQNPISNEKSSAFDKGLTAKKLSPEEAKRAALHDFEENRNMAMHHSHLKAECYLKAREAYQRRSHAVAVYYSNVANLHKSKIDMYNNRAANAIIEVHSYTQQNPDMLDLHYLHTAEAIECLDIFLDQQITQIKAARKGVKFVFVITGRGLHSTGGISTIKQKVKSRLRERGLSWAEVNPGLLKVKLQFISVFSQDLEK